jgi:hypothetical protein
MTKEDELAKSQKPGLASRAIEGLKDAWQDLRIGDGHLEAMGRLGLKELRNAFDPSRGQSVADQELGLYGTATQKEINADRSEGEAQKEPLSVEKLRAEAEERSQQRGKDSPELDRGIDRGRER